MTQNKTSVLDRIMTMSDAMRKSNQNHQPTKEYNTTEPLFETSSRRIPRIIRRHKRRLPPPRQIVHIPIPPGRMRHRRQPRTGGVTPPLQESPVDRSVLLRRPPAPTAIAPVGFGIRHTPIAPSVDATPLQGIVKRLRRRRRGNLPRQQLLRRHGLSVKLFIDPGTRYDDSSVEGYAGVQSLGEGVGVYRGHGPGGGADVGFGSAAQGTEGHADVGAEVDGSSVVAGEEAEGVVSHEEEDVVGDLGSEEGSPGEAGDGYGGGGGPGVGRGFFVLDGVCRVWVIVGGGVVVIAMVVVGVIGIVIVDIAASTTSHHQPRPELEPREPQPALGRSDDRHSLGAPQQPRRDVHPVEIAQRRIQRLARRPVGGVARIRLRRGIGIVSAVVPMVGGQKGPQPPRSTATIPTPLSPRQQIPQSIRRLPDLVPQRKRQGTVAQPPHGIPLVDVIVPHGVAVPQTQFLLEGRQSDAARVARALGMPRQEDAAFESPAVEEGVVVAVVVVIVGV